MKGIADLFARGTKDESKWRTLEKSRWFLATALPRHAHYYALDSPKHPVDDILRSTNGLANFFFKDLWMQRVDGAWTKVYLTQQNSKQNLGWTNKKSQTVESAINLSGGKTSTKKKIEKSIQKDQTTYNS